MLIEQISIELFYEIIRAFEKRGFIQKSDRYNPEIISYFSDLWCAIYLPETIITRNKYFYIKQQFNKINLPRINIVDTTTDFGVFHILFNESHVYLSGQYCQYGNFPYEDPEKFDLPTLAELVVEGALLEERKMKNGGWQKECPATSSA
jgi:hypothetical protein